MNKLLFNIVGFKIVWLACIFGEIYYTSWLGFFVGLIYLSIFFYLEILKLRAIYIISIISLLGYLFDSLMSFFNFYKVDSDVSFLFLPIWFLVLWPSFSSLLVNTLSFLKNNLLLSVFSGGIIGPLTYYFGIGLGLSVVSSYMIFLPIIIFWMMLMYFYNKYI